MRVVVEGLAHRFPGTDLLFEHLDFVAEPGSTIAVCGPSGCGKSTLLSILAGWEKPYAGTVTREGVNRVGWVFQNPYGVAERTALDHVVFPLLAKGMRRKEAELKALEAMGLFDLEYAADRKRLGAKTLFATHYHELTDMEQTLPGVKNFNIAVKKRQGDMIFLRKIVPGAADDSYGVEVAKLAGLPDRVVRRARELLKKLENGAPVKTVRVAADDQISMTNLENDSLRKRLEQLSVETMTPIEAMNALFELKKMI